MKKFLKLNELCLLLLLISNCSCAVNFKKNQWELPAKSESEISVMSFNVENLFDTVHDENTEDYTYLPLVAKKKNLEYQKACKETNSSETRTAECLNMDWNDLQLDAKLNNLSQVVLGVDGVGPDALMLIEVENINVLNIWNNNYLKKANYQTVVLIEGPDKRGIDVGFMSRFPLIGKPVLHKIAWKPQNEEDKKWMEQSRGILEVTVKAPNGSPLTFLVLHFPSQANPPYWRRQAAEFAANLIKEKGPHAMVIAGGDLNITHEEETKERFFSDVLGKAGAVSHFVGCKTCPGTHNYHRSWSFLDAHIYSNALLENGNGAYQLEPSTIDVIRYNGIHLKKGKYPNRWDYEKMDGVSDHFPLYVRLKPRDSVKTATAK